MMKRTHAEGVPHSHQGLDDEAHALAHRIPGTAPLKFRTAVVAAMSGGIAPCPAALVVLLTAITIHQIALGLALIVAFSFGLAGVLTGLGIAVVRSAAWLGKQKRFDLFTRYAPLVSASVIAIIGSTLVGQGLAEQGVPLPNKGFRYRSLPSPPSRCSRSRATRSHRFTRIAQSR